MINSICVFCGASEGKRPEYMQAAETIGAELARRKIELIYGGGTVGLMGAVASNVKAHSGRVTGIIPRSLKIQELASHAIDELVVVETMAERKELMFERSDAFITLPGGFGTLDELFEAVTFGQLGIHAKPVGLLNICGYFDPLLAWVEQAINEGFVRPHHRELVEVSADAVDLLERLQKYQPPQALVAWQKHDKVTR